MTPLEMSKPTVNDFFCGCGGMGLGFKQAGYKTTGAWDYDKYPIQTYRHNVDPIAEQADVSKQHFDNIPAADVWTFGFPCQDLSIAGKQAGMIKGETRSGLFFEIMRLLNEHDMMGMEKPKVIMAENVKALKKHLPVLEEEYTKHGYKMYYTLYNSKYWGVPQNRERYFVVGIRDDIEKEFIFPQQASEINTILLDILDEEVDEKYYYPDEKARKIVEQAIEQMGENWREQFLIDLSQWRREGSLRIYPDYSPTLAARDYKEPRIVLEPKIVAQRGRYNDDGSIYQNSEIQAERITNTLTGVQKDNLLIEPKIEVVGSLSVGEVGDGINISHINSKTRRGRIRKSVAQTLLTGNEQVIIDPNNYRVRKLTPTEYGRLQGFPMDDGWEQVVSNTQAYKQFGNAVTVNVAKVLAEAIKEQILQEGGHINDTHGDEEE